MINPHQLIQNVLVLPTIPFCFWVLCGQAPNLWWYDLQVRIAMTHGPWVIYKRYSWDISGDVNDDLNFEFGDGTVAHNGCGATLFGEFWYFGGGTGSTSANSQKRKVWNFTLGGAMESLESEFLKYIFRWVKWSDANSSNNHWNWILTFTKDLVKHSGRFFRI